MNQKPSLSHSRAVELWTRFVGLFGGDSVARKFGDVPPAEWIGVVAQLTDYQLERGMCRLLASGRAHVPSLPEFRRLCTAIRNDELDAPNGAVPMAALEHWSGDRWVSEANRHLLGHVLQQGHRRVYYDAEATHALVGYKNAWARDCREATPAPSIELQREWWNGCMARAEAEILATRAAQAVAA